MCKTSYESYGELWQSLSRHLKLLFLDVRMQKFRAVLLSLEQTCLLLFNDVNSYLTTIIVIVILNVM